MGWIRTNWLDALIFLLVAVIMAGVVFFLVGVNPLSRPQGNPAPPPDVSTSTQERLPPAAQGVPTPSEPVQQTPAPPQTKPDTKPETVITLLPVPQSPPVEKPVPAPPRVEERKPPSSQPARSAPSAKAERRSLTAEAGGDWRVVVGSFSNRENAERLATTLRQQGYPVGLEASENLTRVWVGPYSQERARAVAAGLEQYQPRIGRLPAPAPRSPQGATGRYLQVGAFRNAQSAQAVVETVQQAGYPVVLVQEGGLVKVRVGPLEDIAAVAANLRARGLEVLEVR
jgi:cell division septation protein DedD